MTSSWSVRNSSYHVSFLPSDGKHNLAVIEPLYLKEREYCQFLSKIPSSTSRTASFIKIKKGNYEYKTQASIYSSTH